jgi:hypothetical protein
MSQRPMKPEVDAVRVQIALYTASHLHRALASDVGEL